MTSGISFSFVEGLGALAHGPCILSQGPGIGLGLRCAFAYLDGLLLSIEVKATGQAAQDASDRAEAAAERRERCMETDEHGRQMRDHGACGDCGMGMGPDWTSD